jgi:uncharacterized protein YegL
MADVKGSVLPIYFVADESGSMASDVGELNKGLSALLDAMNLETMTAAKVRLCVIGFSDTAICHLPMSDFREVPAMPHLSAGGQTSFGSAFRELRARIPADIDALKAQGYMVNRPAVFFLTDGQPTDDDWEQSLAELTSEDFPQRPNVLAFGIGRSEPQTIARLATKPDFGYVVASGTDTGAAIAKFCETLTQSIMHSGQALAAGRSELVVTRPENFTLAIDHV